MIKNLFTAWDSRYNPVTARIETSEEKQEESNVDPDRFFLIIFLTSGMIYRTWIRKSDFDSFRERFQNSRDTIGIKKKFFQFGRHDEFDLTEIAWYQSRPYLVRDEASIDTP